MVELMLENCASLTSITISDNLTALERLTLSNCSHLTSLATPSNITDFGVFELSNCPIESLTIPKRFTLLLEENVPEGCEVHYT